MIKNLLLILVAVLALGACQFSFNSGEDAQKQVVTDPGDPVEREAAFAAADRFLQQVDRGDVEKVWPLVGTYIRNTLRKTAFSAILHTMRLPTGRLKHRERALYGFTTTLEPAVPPGHYFILTFNSMFENTTMTEKVVMNLEQGQWRVAGYFANKSVTFGR